MSVDIYSPRTMARMVAEMKPARSFVLERFFSESQSFESKSVDIDIETSVRSMAPFVGDRSAGSAVDDLGYTTETYTPPLVAPKSLLTEDHLRQRLPGETLYEGRSPAERQAALVGKRLGQLNSMILRREEWMAAQALLTGAVAISGDGVTSRSVDFGAPDALTIALLDAADRWTADTADILANLRTWARLIAQYSGLAADTVILGQEAAAALLGNTALAAMLDKRRVELGLISPEMTTIPGVTYLGSVKGTALDLFSYDEWYIAPATGTETPMITPEMIIMGSTQARAVRYYGAVAVANEGGSLDLMAGERIPDSWTEKEPAGRIIKLSARPLPAPVQIRGFLRATVVA